MRRRFAIRRITSGRCRAAALCAGLAALSMSVLPATSAAKATGNRRGIALERKAIKAISKVRGIRIVRSGHMYSNSSIARVNGYHFFDGPLEDTYPMRESLTMALDHDKLVWEDDRMTPICPAGTQPVTEGCGYQQPLEVVVNRHGMFARFRGPGLPGGNRDHAWDCYMTGKVLKDGFAPDADYGQQWETVDGHYTTVGHAGADPLVTATYPGPWGEGEVYTETDRLSARTHLLKSDHVEASAIKDLRAFSFDERVVKYFRKTPRAPHVTVCGP